MSEPFVDEGQVIRDYGATVPGEYGGFYGKAGGFVALFTENLSRHEESLQDLLPFPDRLEVRHGTRTWRSIEHSKSEVTRILLLDGVHPGVTAAGGVGVRDGQLVVVVGIDPYNTETAEQVVRLVEPHIVDVRRRPQAKSLRSPAM